MAAEETTVVEKIVENKFAVLTWRGNTPSSLTPGMSNQTCPTRHVQPKIDMSDSNQTRRNFVKSSASSALMAANATILVGLINTPGMAGAVTTMGTTGGGVVGSSTKTMGKGVIIRTSTTSEKDAVKQAYGACPGPEVPGAPISGPTIACDEYSCANVTFVDGLWTVTLNEGDTVTKTWKKADLN